MRLGLVTSVSNEAVYLIDWIAHHLALGFGPIHIHYNGCVDGTAPLLDALAQAGVVRAFANDMGSPGLGPRLRALPPITRALRRAGRDATLQACDYLMVCDVDEFLVLPHDATPEALIARLGSPDVISLPWRIFGSNGAQGYDPAPVPDRCPMAAAPDATGPEKRPFGQVKSLFRPIPPQQMGQHAPSKPGIWRLADGRDGHTALTGHTLPDPDHTKGSFHHYHVKSQAEFGVKLIRGYGDKPLGRAVRPGLSSFALMDANDTPCPMPEALTRARRAEATRLRALPGVTAAEDTARARFLKLIEIAKAEITENPALWISPYLRDTDEIRARIARRLSVLSD